MIDEDIDTAQAMADLDVIFANDQLDAILGSTQPIPAEDSSLGTMLGLEVLEDLAHAYPSDQDFQQAMDGCGSLTFPFQYTCMGFRGLRVISSYDGSQHLQQLSRTGEF